jgi:predicted amidohydrolase YtcJ
LNAVATYQQHGYTFIQEGLAGPGELGAYEVVTLAPDFPVTAAMVVGDLSTPDFSQTITEALQAKDRTKLNRNMTIAAVKTFADGSTQGYTAFLNRAYKDVFPPFTNPPFPQPYKGLPDLPEVSSDPSAAKTNLAAFINSRAVTAHAAGFPLVVHQNGDAANDGSFDGLQQARKIVRPRQLRDLVLHAPLISNAELSQAVELNATVSFLSANIYYYGLMLCDQVLGRRALSLYPAKSAFETPGLHVTIHPDSPVTPPYPLFSIWVAKTRKAQQPSWYPNINPQRCPVVLGTDEAISIRRGIQAYTVNAAWQYGMETDLGTVEAGKTADLVILSENPLDMELDPDRLKTIRVLGTIRHGTFFANPNADQTPIWPD